MEKSRGHPDGPGVSCARLNEAFFHKHGSFRRDEVALARPLGERGQLAPHTAVHEIERLVTAVGDPA